MLNFVELARVIFLLLTTKNLFMTKNKTNKRKQLIPREEASFRIAMVHPRDLPPQETFERVKVK